ncbi:MAG: hypothetical protein QM790_05930 [Nibricoccus sp.]
MSPVETTVAETSIDHRRDFETLVLERAAKSRRHARKNDLAATLCYGLALIGSFAASLCAAFTDIPKGALAGITLIPGAALLVISVFAFEKKCRWHRRRKLWYDGLLLRLKFEGATVEALSKEMREHDAKIDREYPRFGAFVPGKDEPGSA